MKVVKVLLVSGFAFLMIFFFNQVPASPADEKSPDVLTLLKNGDLIFQASLSDQSKAIQLATGSRYSHCGIIYKKNNAALVFEAVQPVKNTALKDFINRGEGRHFVIKRLENASEVLTDRVLQRMKTAGDGFLGKDYDKTFEWSDERIYCSELIWKIFKRGADIELGRLQKLGDFDLSHPVVKRILAARYGENVPLEETVISPASIFEDKRLVSVYQSK